MSEATTFTDCARGSHAGGICAICGTTIGRDQRCIRALDDTATGRIIVVLHPDCAADLGLPALMSVTSSLAAQAIATASPAGTRICI